ncbi:MAG: pyridoxamine 5'-phosphate oxidase [Wenzhouxiangellaceae bacterium]|nr:pyridoxamine 5'-phosphate oxidase [Wenzhouxiangellaceae bacterium]
MKLDQEILKRFGDGFDQAVGSGMPEPTAMTLATADAQGRPSARTVLLKGFDADGFVFYTNLGSRKAAHLAENPNAGLVFWWRELEQQVLIEGQASLVSDREADDYFASRPRGSQIGAWASLQSSELDQRQTLLDRVAALEREYDQRKIPRPAHWSGFRVDPVRVEFWYGREFRLHERIVFTADDRGWRRSLLYP